MSAKTILHVEDNELNREIVRDLLRRTSYRVIEAVDGEAGIAMAHEQRPDLILMDVQLPKVSELVKAFLMGRMSAGSYVHGLARKAKIYNGFCLLVGDGDHLFVCSNRAEVPREVQPGVHGLANHLLDTPWPKVVKGRAGLERLTESPFSIDDHGGTGSR